MADPTKRIAVVTGSNKGIGLEIVRQLAFKGITVVLTSRDEKRGLEAIDKLLEDSSIPPDSVIFHRLDVTDSESPATIAQFLKSKFGKLDILVNNAGISGIIVETDAPRVEVQTEAAFEKIIWDKILIQTNSSVVECLETNYFGAKRITEALLPLLHLSQSPRIVNVSSSMGKLKHIPSERIKGVMKDAENLTEERVDEVVNEFLKDFKEGSLETKGWPRELSAYIVSKAAMNAYTRILASKFPRFRVNSVCPGFVKTDINSNTGILSVEEGGESPVRLALLGDDGPSGLFFVKKEESSFED